MANLQPPADLLVRKSYLRRTKLADHIAGRFVIDAATGCWLWRGAKKQRGYGYVWINKAQQLVHRISWTALRGQIPDGLFVCHHCDTTNCINPDHLFLGTHDDNMADMVRKGRAKATIILGSACKHSKLTEAQVLDIVADPRSFHEIGRHYGVAFQHISKIKNGINWQWLTKIGTNHV